LLHFPVYPDSIWLAEPILTIFRISLTPLLLILIPSWRISEPQLKNVFYRKGAVMFRKLLITVVMVLITCSISFAASNKNPLVVMETSKGTVKLELFQKEAPISVANFIGYVNNGFYDGTIFHRVIREFMIQGGGFTADLKQKPAKAPIKNEAANGLKNQRGTLAMARTGIVDSATAQFFINLVDNKFLDHRDTSTQGYGYAVFGKVVEGMDVVDRIARSKTGYVPRFENIPDETVLIKSIRVVSK
jgi:peptidyl-prolyl cis-trans isomerase A (cyclophilin A)